MTVINVPESLEMILISSDETKEDSWSSEFETSNNSDSSYKMREWKKKRKQQKELDMGGFQWDVSLWICNKM